MLCGLMAALAILPVTAAFAQDAQVFPNDYFASANPADAYDMLRKVPGFELIEGDEDVRGFSGSRGNVLFDGRPPAGKEETLEQALRRIPAANVLRIELIRGGATSSATGGYDLVANIVRRKVAATSHSVQSGASAAEGVGIKPDGRFELSHQAGDRRVEGAISLTTDIDDDSGAGSIVERDVDGGSIEREDRVEREFTRALSGNAEYKAPLGAGELVATLNASRERTRERIRTDDDLAQESERLWEVEAGAQFKTDVAYGELETTAVQRLGWLRIHAEEENEAFRESTRTSESIVRSEYRGGADSLRYFGSIEAALNRLTSDTSLSEGGVEVPILGSDVDVGERRIEGAAGVIWKPSPSLTVEPTMRVERSNIRSTGDSSQDDSFVFLKPRLRATWERARSRVQVTIEREAAQLDFGDFVASAELGRDDVIAGATSLKPPTTWSVSATLEQRFWGSGAILVTLRRERIDDVIDRVVIEQDGELFDAVGNIGSGSRSIARAELTLPFERFGLSGLQLRSSLTALKSRVRDPITGRRRIISEDRPFEGEIRVIHDLQGGRWSWGADASFAHREREYRFDEIREERKGTAFGGYVEFRPARSWRLRAEVENLGSRQLAEDREKFEGLRSTSEVDSIETRSLRTSPIFSLSVRRSFGGAPDQDGSEP